MSFELFLKALRQLLEPVTAKADTGKGELEGVSMKKAKATKKTAAKPAKKASAKKAPAAKAKNVVAKPSKAAAAKAKVVVQKPTTLSKAPTKPSLKLESPKAEKTMELSKKAETEKTAKPAAKTLKEALAGTLKKAADMEPDAVLHAVEQHDATEQEKKALARKLTQAGTNFENVYKIAKVMKPKNYKMSESFEARTPIMHKVLGWGFILSCENNRIQVLFEEGVKTLITNYQK